MITLLEKYHAYAPPFKYEPATGGEPYVGGVEGRVPWTDDLGNRLKSAWEDANAKMVQREFQIPSAHQVGVFYTVRKMMGGWTCTCPARGRCWHIKICREKDEEENPVKRSNNYDGDI